MKLRILSMLKKQKKHLSFHTPGHKRKGYDITELSYSDNLYAPRGVLAETERDIAEILGADGSFLLTDGSTSGIFSMLGALRDFKIRRIAVPAASHPSVFHAAEVLSLELLLIPTRYEKGIPAQPTEEELAAAVKNADALLLTSPDYYGFFPPLKTAQTLCNSAGIPLVIDGAHGAHLHGTELHASMYADLWVDGVHKSLPALTQGAAVSAKGRYLPALAENVKKFRTTSPSYPIMASVEYALKFPISPALIAAAEECKRACGCVENEDWTKLLVPFGTAGEAAMQTLEKKGIYAEFFDGNYILFYLSPANTLRDLKRLKCAIRNLPRGEISGEGHIPIYSD